MSTPSDESAPVPAAPPAPPTAYDPTPTAPGTVADRPEVMVGAAFAGGVLLAMVLKRLGR